MNGYEKAKELNERLKAENAATEEVSKGDKQVALNQLALVRENSSLSATYDRLAKEEEKESGGSQPLLKLHTAGRSNNVLLDGSQPEDGSFFYVPTQEAFKDPSIHLLTISEGFYAEGLLDDGGKPKIGYNILLGGTIIYDNNMRPFIMYVTSQSIRQSVWEFRNEINKYARLMRVPKFALTVNMVSEKVSNPNPKWVKANPKVNNIKFSIKKFEDNTPHLVMDEGELVALADIKEMLKEMIDSIIAKKRVEKPESQDTLETKPTHSIDIDPRDQVLDENGRPF